MFHKISFRNGFAGLSAALLLAGLALAQERKTRIDVENYLIDVDVNQNTQTLAAKKRRCGSSPLDDNTTSVPFELNNALNVTKVVDQQNREIQTSRSQQDFTVHLNFEQPLEKNKPTTVTFYYERSADGPGRFAGLRDQICRDSKQLRLT